MARFLPRVTILGFPLNPGPFTIKEHVVVTIMAGVGAETAYAVRLLFHLPIILVASLTSVKTDIVAVQRLHYGKIYNFGYQFMVVMSTQLIGFSIGGIAKRFLVSPPSMSMSTVQPSKPCSEGLTCFLPSLATKPRILCTLQHSAFPSLRWYW